MVLFFFFFLFLYSFFAFILSSFVPFSFLACSFFLSHIRMDLLQPTDQRSIVLFDWGICAWFWHENNTHRSLTSDCITKLCSGFDEAVENFFLFAQHWEMGNQIQRKDIPSENYDSTFVFARFSYQFRDFWNSSLHLLASVCLRITTLRTQKFEKILYLQKSRF